ncbi:phage integrase family protein [Caballeronia sp. LZ062]|uniref:phage integrase family protein n=1 Tax=unclassified Caballeronia TaxID=2646786 RepID=UPI0028561840|nr:MULTISPECIES: phage integrase family protein [unclassified Caballeronia]MDR5856346.1 phage integrase family protein [Caballeronia sp. LZ050]MDR5873016.1 phage integrase family protein [Caballeronia sp. LZ062]
MADFKDEKILKPAVLHGDSAPRRLTRQHFALYRGYLDGVSEAQLHASYGDASSDVRSTRRLIATLRDTLSVLARRAHDVEAAHLLRLRPGSIPSAPAEPTSDAPSLDAFRERVDPEGVFGESELLTLYREAFPPGASPATDRRTARNIRLRRRQADALARMEASLVHDPRPDHPIDGWFEPAVAARLAAAGIATIADLITLIETRRHRWYTAVPRLGPNGAQRIVDWLQLHSDALRHTFSPRALVPRRQWTPDFAAAPVAAAEAIQMAPLETMRVPAALDGSKGTNRAESYTGRFQTDIQAITGWLDARSASDHTRRAYRREAERLLLWALIERSKPLSSLDALDCREYIHTFLPDPQPAARWVAKGRVERCVAGWRPFAGPLSDRSRESARSILSAMCEWLVAAGYLAKNPFAGLERAAVPSVFDAETRTLDFEQWKLVFRSVSRSAYTFSEHRDRLALLLAYSTGLRRAELAAATTDALTVGRVPGIDGPVWRLSVANTARRGGGRSVLLPPIVMQALQENLAMRGLPDPLSCPEGTPLLAQARIGRAITPDGVGKLFKTIFAAAAAQAEADDPGSGRRLALASTHWLRHTHSAHALAHGAELVEVGKGLGHARVSTTLLYLESDGSRRLLGVEKLLRETLAPGYPSESA